MPMMPVKAVGVQHIEQTLAAAVQWVASCEEVCAAAGRDYADAKHKSEVAESIAQGLLSQWYGERQR